MDNDNFKTAVIAALRQLIRPIARLMLYAGVPWREFAEHVKQEFVAVATAEFGVNGRPTNVSRVSLLTGIARKEVRRLRELSEAEKATDANPRTTTGATRLLGTWHQDNTYVGTDGKALEMPLKGPAPSFEALHRRCGCDIPETTMLKELVRAGAVRIEDERVRALTRYYMPSALDAESVLRAGSVIEDLGETVTFNLRNRPKGRTRFEARATNDAVRADQAAAFDLFVRERAMAFLEEIDGWLTHHQATGDEPAVRMGIGVFRIHENSSKDREDSK